MRPEQVGVLVAERHRRTDLHHVVIRAVGARAGSPARASDSTTYDASVAGRLERRRDRARAPRRGTAPSRARRRRARDGRPAAAAPPACRSPTRSACACSPSSRSTSSTASPIAHDTVLPPNVLKNSIPLSNAAAISGVVTTAPSGWPLPSGLPATRCPGRRPGPRTPRSSCPCDRARSAPRRRCTRRRPRARCRYTSARYPGGSTICPPTLGHVSAMNPPSRRSATRATRRFAASICRVTARRRPDRSPCTAPR